MAIHDEKEFLGHFIFTCDLLQLFGKLASGLLVFQDPRKSGETLVGTGKIIFMYPSVNWCSMEEQQCAGNLKNRNTNCFKPQFLVDPASEFYSCILIEIRINIAVFYNCILLMRGVLAHAWLGTDR